MSTDSPTFDPIIDRVAAACEVPAWWVSVRYAKGMPSDETDGPYRWSIDVTVIRTAARKYDQTTITGGGATVEEAATAVIEAVARGYACGDYGPAASSKRKR